MKAMHALSVTVFLTYALLASPPLARAQLQKIPEPIADAYQPVTSFDELKSGSNQLRFEKSEPALRLKKNVPFLLGRKDNNLWVCSVTLSGSYHPELVIPKTMTFTRIYHSDRQNGPRTNRVRSFTQKYQAQEYVYIPDKSGELYRPEITLTCNNTESPKVVNAVDVMEGLKQALYLSGGVLRSTRKVEPKPSVEAAPIGGPAPAQIPGT